MNGKLGFSVLLAAVLFGLAIVPVMAAKPLEVHIEVPATIDGSGGDRYTATGPAVDRGVMCPTGDVFDLSLIVRGPSGGTFSILTILKRFVCDDGSGTFDVKLIVRLDWATSKTTANWRVIGGTGDYSRLRGNGRLIGIPIVPGASILDVYDGKLH